MPIEQQPSPALMTDSALPMSLAALSVPDRPEAARILIADDTRVDVLILRRILAEAGFREVSYCQEAPRVLEQYRRERPHLILLDLNMPGLSGQEIIAALMNEAPPTARPLIVVITGEAERDRRIAALAAGAADFLNKPVDREELRLRVYNLLEARLLHQRLQASEQRFALAMRISNEGLLDWDWRTDRIYLSPRWQQLCLGHWDGVTELDRAACQQRLIAAGYVEPWAALQACWASATVDLDRTFRIERGNGPPRWHRLQGIGIEDDRKEVTRLVCTCQDVTAAVEDRLALQEALNAAKAGDRAKSEFLARVSHELRTPLTAIIGFAEAIETSCTTDHPKCRGFQRAILGNARQLHALINDVLDLSKIQAGQLISERVPVHLFELLAEFGQLIAAQAEAKGLDFALTLIPPLPECIYTDPTQLRQILHNLCGNALKFTDRGYLRLAVSYNPEAEELICTVTDSGIGFDDQQATRLFAPFVQADSSITRRFGGTGLGLAISRGLAERLGGNLLASSIPGAGSVFVLTVATGPLPLAALHDDISDLEVLARRRDRPQAAVPHLRGRVLIAEDNRDIQDLLRYYLEPTGIELVFMDHGEAAVETALAESFDLVLLDLQMPVMGGLEALQILRQCLYDRPILILTAHALSEERAEVLAAGADGFLTKPIDAGLLYASLKEYLVEQIDDPGTTASAPVGPKIDLHDLKQRFVANLPHDLALLEAAGQHRNRPQVQHLAHQLRGVASSLGYPVLAQIAAALDPPPADPEMTLHILAELSLAVTKVCENDDINLSKDG